MDTTKCVYTVLFTQFRSNLAINKGLIRETENYWLLTWRSYLCNVGGFPTEKMYFFLRKAS